MERPGHGARQAWAARPETPPRSRVPLPSAREIEILSLIASGLSNAAIGRRLFISDETVKSHVHSLLAKLGARNRTHAVSVAIMSGLLDLDARDERARDLS